MGGEDVELEGTGRGSEDGPPQQGLGLLRCAACGNKTRFDVVESKRVRAFHHFTLGGRVTVEDEEVLERVVERVTCRWCGASDAIVTEPPQLEA